MNTLCFVASGSGGHIIPCLTIAQKNKTPHTKILFFTGTSDLDKQLTNTQTIDTRVFLNLGKFPYKKLYLYPVFIAQFCLCFFKSLFVLTHSKPQEIITTGGYLAIPVTYAARVLRIPVTFWELNVLPGKTVKLLACHAQKINICFAQTQEYLKKYPCTLTPYPIRWHERDKISRAEAIKILNLSPDKKTIFILGGSQGSQELNSLIKTCLETYPELKSSIQILHQTGAGNSSNWHEFYAQNNIPALVFEYRTDINVLMCAADLIVSRAGAGALAEIVFFEKQAIIIPLELAHDNHQVLNACAVAEQHKNIIVCTLTEAPENILKKLFE